MKGAQKRYIKRAMSYVWFIAFIGWLFMAIGVAFFKYDPGTITRTLSFLLAAAYFYTLYEKSNQPERDKGKGGAA